jgi:hypothetical protein
VIARIKKLFSCVGLIVDEMKKLGLSILTSDPSSLSSGRLMILTFPVFALVVLSCVFVHILKMKDVATAHEWLSALPSIFGGLTALCGIPYGISRALAPW